MPVMNNLMLIKRLSKILNKGFNPCYTFLNDIKKYSYSEIVSHIGDNDNGNSHRILKVLIDKGFIRKIIDCDGDSRYYIDINEIQEFVNINRGVVDDALTEAIRKTEEIKMIAKISGRINSLRPPKFIEDDDEDDEKVRVGVPVISGVLK